MPRSSDQNLWLTAADCASRTGVTVRALRVYERLGLLKPRRTAANWRLYGSADIARLAEIGALKRLGLSLSRIADLLAGKSTDLATLLQMQKETLTAQRERADQALRTVALLQRQFDEVQSLSIDDIFNLMETATMADNLKDTTAWKRYEQARPRGAIKMSASQLAPYSGSYLLETGVGCTIRIADEHLTVRLTGQVEVQAFPEGEDRFFLDIVPAQIVFMRNAEGQVDALEIHQNGLEQKAKRVSEDVVTEIEAALQARILAKTASTDSETRMRTTIAQHQAGEIDYDSMTPDLAALVRGQAGAILPQLRKLGNLKALAFKGVSADGWDVYEATFDNGKVEWSFVLDDAGKFSGMLLRPVV